MSEKTRGAGAGLESWTFAEIREALEAATRLAERIHELESDEWLEAGEAAAYLRMGKSEFKLRAARGEIPRHPTSPSRYKYHRPELREWLKSRTEEPEDESI